MAAKSGMQKNHKYQKVNKSKTYERLAGAVMPLKQIENILSEKLNDLKVKGTLKGEEKVITDILV